MHFRCSAFVGAFFPVYKLQSRRITQLSATSPHSLRRIFPLVRRRAVSRNSWVCNAQATTFASQATERPNFQRLTTLAHVYAGLFAKPGDTVIDATCGNGNDTALLLSLVCPSLGSGAHVSESEGTVVAMDISEEAVLQTRRHLQTTFPAFDLDRAMDLGTVQFVLGCHSTFPKDLKEGSVSLVMWNLGYLPKTDKSWSTVLETTLKSIEEAMRLLTQGGALIITAYPGHLEGAREEAGVSTFLSSLSKDWVVLHSRLVNRSPTSPTVFLVQKSF